jgi:hypothetical protein
MGTEPPGLPTQVVNADLSAGVRIPKYQIDEPFDGVLVAPTRLGRGERIEHCRPRFIAEELCNFRKDHPLNETQFDSLSLLYLLATTAEAGDIHFNVPKLLSLLKDTHVKRADLLRLLLPGSAREISLSAFEALKKQFPAFVRSDGAEPTSTWKLQSTAEVAEEMESLADSLGLKSSGLAHVFWSMFWSDRASGGLPEAFLQRKLASHLKKADLSLCPEELHDKLRPQLFEAALATCAGLRKTCIFKENALRDTIVKAVDFFVGATPEQRSQWTDRLLQSCWEAYSILGQDSILPF